MTKSQEVFRYYRDVALRMGFEPEKGGLATDVCQMSAAELMHHQSGYSVAGFYQRCESLVRSKSFGTYHPLMAAFLGDEGALREVRDKIERASCPYTRSELEPLFSKVARLDPEDVGQTKAVLRALSQPLTIVQGPPGTGKSQTIANIVSCIQELKTGKAGGRPTVAITSTNKEAVSNALEGIWDLERVRDEHGHALRPLCVQLGNKDVRAQAIRELRVQGHAGRLKDAGVPDPYKGGSLPLRFLDEYPIFGCTLHSLYKCLDGAEAFDYVIVDEGSQVPNYLGLIALCIQE